MPAKQQIEREMVEAGGAQSWLISSLSDRIRPAKECPFPSAWDFLARAVWTKDEASGRIVQFPNDEEHAYLRYITEERPKHKIFAIEKSRRMMATWLLLCLYLYDTLTKPNHANFIVSKKLEDSAYLLGEERMLGVWRRIPADVWPGKPDLVEKGKCGLGYELLTCPQTGSYVRAIASGADQLRSYTASNVFFDEFAFQERQREAWAATKPTVEGGGHVDIASTPELGAYMYDLLYGEDAA